MVCKARPTRPRHNIPKVASRDLIDYFYGEINTYMHVQNIKVTRIDVYETLCPQQMLVHKGGKIKNWGEECRDVTPQKIADSKYQGRCEQRSEVFVKTFFFGGGGCQVGGGRVGGSGWM